MENQVKYLTEKEASNLTGMALPTLRNARHLGRGIPYCKIGRSVRYCWQDIVDFMEQRKIQTEN
jgi:predicted DNA-binding transcriptional regulator AlpA